MECYWINKNVRINNSKNVIRYKFLLRNFEVETMRDVLSSVPMYDVHFAHTIVSALVKYTKNIISSGNDT